jgi:hypothetical protein
MKYWDREDGMVKVKPLPSFSEEETTEMEMEPSRAAAAAAWLALSDDVDDLSVTADADGSLSGDSGDRVCDLLGDFESAHDLATPWNDRPKVIARNMVRHIVNRALRETVPKQPSRFAACFGGCVSKLDEPAPLRRRSRRI